MIFRLEVKLNGRWKLFATAEVNSDYFVSPKHFLEMARKPGGFNMIVEYDEYLQMMLDKVEAFKTMEWRANGLKFTGHRGREYYFGGISDSRQITFMFDE